MSSYIHVGYLAFTRTSSPPPTPPTSILFNVPALVNNPIHHVKNPHFDKLRCKEYLQIKLWESRLVAAFAFFCFASSSSRCVMVGNILYQK